MEYIFLRTRQTPSHCGYSINMGKCNFHMSRPFSVLLLLCAGLVLAAGDMEELTTAAQRGDAGAQFLLGSRYDHGQGVPEDDAEAVRWYHLAAEQGHASAQYYLGYKFAQGEGVARDTGEAVRWLREAAGQGHAAAQYRLGAMYFNDAEAPVDKAEAARWLRAAAEQGHAGAQKRLREYQETYGPADAGRRICGNRDSGCCRIICVTGTDL